MTEPPRKRSTRRAKIDPAQFNAVVAHARLSGLRLVETRFDVRPGALSKDRQHWTYRVEDALSDWHLDCDSRLLRGQYAYSALCIEGRRRPVVLRASYLATYRLSGACEEDAALAYLRRVGRFSCYPYFRALFSILTEQSGLQLPPLPVIAEQPRLVRTD